MGYEEKRQKKTEENKNQRITKTHFLNRSQTLGFIRLFVRSFDGRFVWMVRKFAIRA